MPPICFLWTGQSVQWNLDLNEGPRNWQNSFALLRLFFFIILFYYYWGKENHLFYLGPHYVEVHYIEVPLCRGDVVLSFLETLPKALS